MRRGRPPTDDILTPRQWEVLGLLREGLTYEQIAERLGISYDGAKYHVSEIITKLGVANRYEAARWEPSQPAVRRAGVFGALAGLRAGLALKTIPALSVAGAAVALALLAIGVFVMEARQQGAFDTATGKIAFVRDGDIWVKELPGGNEQRLTTDGVNLMPRWSLSGEWLLFGKEETPGGGGLRSWVMRGDGSDARFVDRTLATWSPSEDLLAFMAWDSAASNDDRGEIVVERPDGSGRRQLVPPVDHGTVFTTGLSTFRTSFLSWSPDGRWLAFTEQVRVIPRDLEGYCDCSEYVVIKRVAADGSTGVQTIYQGDLDMELAAWDGWSADSRFYLFAMRPSTSSGNGTRVSSIGSDDASTPAAQRSQEPPPLPQPWSPIMAAPVDGSTPRETNVRVHWNDASAIVRSPDGRTVAVVEGGDRQSWVDKRLALFDPASGGMTHLTSPDIAAISPDWSPDGRQLVYVAAPEAPGASSPQVALAAINQRHIWVVDRDGGNARALTEDARYRDEHPRWSADGRHILFARIDLQAETPSMSLWLLEVATGDLRQVLDGLEVIDGGDGFLWTEERLLDYWRAP